MNANRLYSSAILIVTTTSINMWLTKLTIIACLLLATGYAQRTRPMRRPATQAPNPEAKPVESGCLAELQAQQDLKIQFNLPRRFLVVARKRSNRMFGRTFDNLNGQGKITAAGDGYNSTNIISVVITTNEGAEQVSRNMYFHGVVGPYPH